MSVSTEEKKSILSLLPYCNETVVVYDVGSNKGAWADVIINERDSSILAGKYNIHLFEPNKLLLDYTRVKYDYHNNIIFNQVAAYKEDGAVLPFYFFSNKNSGLSSVYYNEKWANLPMEETTVKSIRLDTYCKEWIDFIKIDTEGSECDVILGCEKILKEKGAKFIQVEYSEHYKLSNATFKSLIYHMESFGYFCHEWDGEYFQKVEAETFIEDYRLSNFMFSYLPITRYHYTQPSWNKEFIKNTEGLGRFNLLLEVGCFEGLTTNYICDNLLNEGGRVICVDPLEDVYLSDDEKANEGLDYFKGQYERFVKNTKGQPIELVRKKSQDVYEYLNQYCYDLIYLDGDHREEAIYNDAKNLYPSARMGGYILFDDYTWSEETKSGIDKFLEEFKGRYEVVIKDYQVLIKKIAE